MREYEDGDDRFTVDEETIGAVRERLDNRAFLEAAHYLHERGYAIPAIQMITADLYGVSQNCAGFLSRWQPEESDAQQQDINDSFFALAKGYRNLRTYLDTMSWS